MAQLIADRVAMPLAEDIRLARGILQPSSSVGVSWTESTAVTADEMLARAYAAMQAAKRAGGRIAVPYRELRRQK